MACKKRFEPLQAEIPFLARSTDYGVQVNAEQFKRLVEREDGLAGDDPDQLWSELEKVPGVSNVDYEETEPPNITFTLAYSENWTETRNKIREIIKKHLERE